MEKCVEYYLAGPLLRVFVCVTIKYRFENIAFGL